MIAWLARGSVGERLQCVALALGDAVHPAPEIAIGNSRK